MVSNQQAQHKPGYSSILLLPLIKDGTKSTDANSGSDGRVTVIVKPKQPTITTNVANKKGLTNQQITVNVGSGVKERFNS